MDTKKIFKNCIHKVCDGEICLINPINLRGLLNWYLTSPLSIPLLGGFDRTETVVKVSRKNVINITYSKRDSTGKNYKLKSFEEVQDFLFKNELMLTIDLFSFSPNTIIDRTFERRSWYKYIVVDDIANDQEVVPIQVINTVDSEIPDLQEYVMQSVYADDQRHNRRITVCCDCEDNCKDKLKCACFQETLNRYDQDKREAIGDTGIGYEFKTLPKRRQTLSGIYECNARCQCNENCGNRVVQFPSKWRFQIYKEDATAAKGWSGRTLFDIPAGAFVTNYCGEMFQEDRANMISQDSEWKQNDKWKYFVNLQVIQNAKRSTKRFKREEVSPSSDSGIEADNESPPSKMRKTDDVKPFPILKFGILDIRKIFTVVAGVELNTDLYKSYQTQMAKNSLETMNLCRSVMLQAINKPKVESSQKQKLISKKGSCRVLCESTKFNNQSATSKKKVSSLVDDPKLQMNAVVKISSEEINKHKSSTSVSEPQPGPSIKKTETKIKGKYALRGIETKCYTFDVDPSMKNLRKLSKRVVPTVTVTKDCHVVDGRVVGNVGRFFNHSCDPNMFCQYVFVDNQDVRFPVVSFFAARDIKAGEELTWSYNYDDDDEAEETMIKTEVEKENTPAVRPVNGDVVECLCGAKNCTKRLI